MEIPVLWQDADLLAVNKPAGLLSIRDGYDPALPHLVGLLSATYGPLWVVHRLDKDTSGVIVFARTPQAHRNLNQQFERRETRKEYHALVVGSPDWEKQTISLPLRVNGDRRHRTVIDETNGRPAATLCQVLRRFACCSLIQASPQTGYTHQIRAHLAAVGFPLWMDPLYKSLVDPGKIQERLDLPIQRTALHAFQIAFHHPTRTDRITVQAPYPDDFQNAIQFLQS